MNPGQQQAEVRRKVTTPGMSDCPPGVSRRKWRYWTPERRQKELWRYWYGLPEETKKALDIKYGYGLTRAARRAAFRGAA